MKADNPDFHAIHLGISGFPNGLGAMQRLILLFRGLASAGVKTLVINRKGRYAHGTYDSLKVQGTFMEVPYQYMTSSPYRPSGFLRRNLHKLSGFINELVLIGKKKKSDELDVAILYILGEFHLLLYYYMLSRIFRFPIVLNYVELNSSFENRTFGQRLNDRIFDRFSPKLADGFLPISDYLYNHIAKYAPSAPQLKLPVVADFETSKPCPASEPMHLLYCGAASYQPLIDFVIKSFERVTVGKTQLHLLLGGTHAEIDLVKEMLGSSTKAASCKLFVNVPHRDIAEKLAAATGLLIPVRPSIQDAARFPHKVGEYLASGTPLVSTAFGEIPNYLKDGETAYIARSFDVATFAEKIDDLLSDPVRARYIGQEGRKKGIESFDYKIHGARLANFVQGLVHP